MDHTAPAPDRTQDSRMITTGSGPRTVLSLTRMPVGPLQRPPNTGPGTSSPHTHRR